MTYQPYLIANYATGLNNRLQPWLLPDDAQEEIFDGYVFLGVMSKREGYKYWAIGGPPGGKPYRESRIVHTLSAVSMSGTINSSNKVFTLAGTAQIARGSVTVTGSNPSQVLTDNGLGLIGSLTGAGTGTVDYLSGAISVTFAAAPTSGSVTVTYSYMPGNPVMMIATFIDATNVKNTIVADTKYVNSYNNTYNILQDISASGVTYTGTSFDFFTWTNYAAADSTPRLLFSNNVDVIQQWNGSAVTAYSYTMHTIATMPVAITSLTCAFMVEMKDRLILLRTTEGGTVFPQRIRISGTGDASDVFDSSVSAPGAGAITLPDSSWIQGAAFSRDDLIIFTETSTWVMKYTGNDTTPFAIDKIDDSRGCDASFSIITYLNRTSAASPRGLIISDGYRVERQDEDIPDFSFDEVSSMNFSLCYAGSVDTDKDHYLIYPQQANESTYAFSSRILTTNYDEDNYAIYRFPLSCMGTAQTAFTITWNDLLQYTNWNDFGNAYGNWNSFAYNSGVPFPLGGGHFGEIWQLAINESEDNPVNIYNITVVDAQTIQVTTDWNNYGLNPYDVSKGADYIQLTGITGMEEINNQQFPIKTWVNHNQFNLDVSTAIVPATSFTDYASGGRAVRVIPFTALFKKFNPYANQDKKVRCGWLYMYVDSSGTGLQRNVIITNITQSNPCVVTTNVNHNVNNGDQVTFFGIGGMTQLNGTQAFVTVLTPTSFSLNGVDSTSFGAYTSGGYVGAKELAKMSIDIITNDNNLPDVTKSAISPDPYQGNMTNMTFETGSKKWYKVFINQTGRFIQFRLRNQQAGAKINIHATMPGFQPVGRLI